MEAEIADGPEQAALPLARSEAIWVARLNAVMEIRRLMRANALTIDDLRKAFKGTKLAGPKSQFLEQTSSGQIDAEPPSYEALSGEMDDSTMTESLRQKGNGLASTPSCGAALVLPGVE